MIPNKTKHKQLSKLLWALGVICGVGFYGFMWQSTQLACERPGPGEHINCTSKVKAFWLIPLKTKAVHDLQGAQLIESIDDEGDAVYQVDRLTAQESVPITALFSAVAKVKLEVIEIINAFVNNNIETRSVVTEPGYLSRENIFWILLPVIVILLP